MHCVKHVLTPSWRTGHPIIHPSITSSQLFFLPWQNDTRLQLCSPGATRVPGHLSRKVKIQVDSLGTYCSLRSYGKLPKLTNFKMADPQQSPDFCLLRRRIGSWIHPQLAPEVLRKTSFQLGSSRYSCQHKDKYFLWNKWFKIKIRLELVLSKTLFVVTTLLGAIEDCRNVCMHKYLLHALKNILFVLASREPTVVTPKWIWFPCLPMSSRSLVWMFACFWVPCSSYWGSLANTFKRVRLVAALHFVIDLSGGAWHFLVRKQPQIHKNWQEEPKNANPRRNLWCSNSLEV